MGQKKNLSILEYSRLTGIKRDNLRFYDRIGLLKPEIRGENGYRYYTRRQLSSAYLISGLRLLGVHSHEAAMIGDRMDTDIVAGIETGLDTVLVLSGCTSRQDVENYAYRPHFILDGVGCIPPQA